MLKAHTPHSLVEERAQVFFKNIFEDNIWQSNMDL